MVDSSVSGPEAFSKSTITESSIVEFIVELFRSLLEFEFSRNPSKRLVEFSSSVNGCEFACSFVRFFLVLLALANMETISCLLESCSCSPDWF